ncbi:MAG: CDP-glycerol glycerophosphotransferase family protein [Thermodesulfobacteriota bacterium]
MKFLKLLSFQTLFYFAGYLVAIPLSYLIPKKRNLIMFLGREHDLFIDNVKYLFLHIHNFNKDFEIYFYTTNQNVYDELRLNELPVILHPSLSCLTKDIKGTLRSLYLIFRTNSIIVDSGFWSSRLRYYLFYNTYKIQLWHGVPLKQIGLQELRSNIKKKVHMHLLKYDTVISTSDFFTEECFKKAFYAENIIESGYPRNDVLFRNFNSNELIGTDINNFDKIKDYKANNFKIVLYAPTFRDMGGDAFTENKLDLEKISRFLTENNIIFMVKMHSIVNSSQQSALSKNNILFYNNSKDIYPVLKYTDVLITDYSSIYFDYLMLNKPIIYFPYDLNEYIEKNRNLNFDYNDMTPGPKAFNQADLLKLLSNILIDNKDEFSVERKRILKLSFNHIDGNASSRITDYLTDKLL